MNEQSQASAVATTGRVVRAQVAALVDSLRDVDAAQWDAPSACTEWAIGDVAAHMAESNDRFLQIVEATLADAAVPAFSPQERVARQAAVKAGGSAAVLAQLQQRVGAVFDRLEGASPEQLARTVQVPAGQLSLAQVAGQRLSEVTLHCWDIRSARQRGATLDPEGAALLLDSILANVPRLANKEALGDRRATYGLELSGPGGGPITLAIADGAARASRGATATADATLRLPVEAAIRLFWGRLDLERGIAEGLVAVQGDETAVRSLAGVFRGV